MFTKTYSDMYIDRSLIFSEALWKLSGTAVKIYLVFLNKRRMKKFEGSKGKRSGKDKYYIANNGKIQFSYREATEKYNIKPKRFTRAISQLIEYGFIDIAQSSYGLHKDPTLYAVSERWQKYGTPEFVPAKRIKRELQYGGFRKGNKQGRNSRPKRIKLVPAG